MAAMAMPTMPMVMTHDPLATMVALRRMRIATTMTTTTDGDDNKNVDGERGGC